MKYLLLILLIGYSRGEEPVKETPEHKGDWIDTVRREVNRDGDIIYFFKQKDGTWEHFNDSEHTRNIIGKNND